MKKSLNIYKQILEETTGYGLVVYYLDMDEGTYQEVIRVNDSCLQVQDPFPAEFFSACVLFESIKNHLIQSVYFCVYKNEFGSEWFISDLSK